MYWIYFFNYSSLFSMRYWSIWCIFSSRACIFKLFRVRIEYRVPFTWVRTTMFSCSMSSLSTFKTLFFGSSSHLFLPWTRRLRFMRRAVVYSKLYSDRFWCASYWRVWMIHLITSSLIIIVCASLLKLNFWRAPNAFYLREVSWSFWLKRISIRVLTMSFLWSK